MISGYSDHAADERTFLAWVRTGGPEANLIFRFVALLLRECWYFRQKFLRDSDFRAISVGILPECQKFLIALLGRRRVAACLRRLSDSVDDPGAARSAFQRLQKSFLGVRGPIQLHQQRAKEFVG